MNTNYGKIIQSGAAIEYAPDFFSPNPGIPTESDYLGRGWLKVNITPPSPQEGEQVATTRYEESDGVIVAVYTYEPTRKVYRVAYLFEWIEDHGLTNRLVEAIGLSRMLQAAAIGEIDSSNEDFAAILPAIQAALDLTDEQVAECLEYAAEA